VIPVKIKVTRVESLKLTARCDIRGDNCVITDS
jgi:hypothetical protein